MRKLMQTVWRKKNHKSWYLAEAFNSPSAMRGRIALRKHFPPQRAVRNLLPTYHRYSLTGADAALGVPWASQSALVWE